MELELPREIECPPLGEEKLSFEKSVKGDVGCCFLLMLWPETSINLQLLNRRDLIGGLRKTIKTLVEVQSLF